MKIWKHVVGLSSICIEGLKVIIPFSSFIAFLFLSIFVDESRRLSLLSGFNTCGIVCLLFLPLSLCRHWGLHTFPFCLFHRGHIGSLVGPGEHPLG